MKRFRILGVALLAIFAFAAVNSAMASAEVVVLGGATTFTGSGGSGTLETVGGTKVLCAAQTSEGTIETGKPLGTYHIHFTGCEASILGAKLPCSSLDHSISEKTILTLGTYHYVFDTLGATLAQNGIAVLFLAEHLHFTCESGIIKALVLVLGQVLCLITPVNASATTFTIKCEQTKGVPSETTYWNEAGTEVKLGTTALKSATNEGSEEGAGELTTGTLEPNKATELMT